MVRQKGTLATFCCAAGAFCWRANWEAIQATAAPSSADGVDCSKFFSMASSVWQCAQPARCAAAFASPEGVSTMRSSVSSGRHSLVSAAASCHIFKVLVLSAMTNLLGAMLLPASVLLRDRSEEHTSELQSQFHLVCR